MKDNTKKNSCFIQNSVFYARLKQVCVNVLRIFIRNVLNLISATVIAPRATKKV